MTHGLPILRDLLLVAGVSLAVLGVFGRLRLPPAAGLVASGILLGPAGLGLIRDPSLVGTLAEFGVMLLLFTVGLEFSVADFRRLGKAALIGGPLYVGLVSATAAAVFVFAGVHPAPAVLFGLLTALSSTAVVFRVLLDRAELGSPHGRWVTGVLVFQDLMVIPAAIALPALARWHGGATPVAHGGSPLVQAVTLAALAVMALASGRVVPWLVQRASRARSREAFLFGVVLVALGGAYAASLAGLSPALGAFVVGLILANSDLRTQVEADVLPLRDMLASVFFVTIGMLLDREVLLEQPVLVLLTAAGLLALKMVIGYFALRLAGASGRVSFAAALALAQVGEFSFVLLQAAAPVGLVPPVGGQAFLAGAIVSLALTPWLVSNAPEWAIGFDLRFGGASRSGRRGDGDDEHAPAHSLLYANHVIVAGFGLNGRNVARVLRAVHVPHVVVDLDPDALLQARRDGSPVLHGDVTKPLVLHHAGITRARVMVFALSDPTATRHACRVARDLAPGLFSVVRTRHVAEIDGLYAVGANLVIPEEFETSIEIFTAVLRELHVPMNVVEAQIRLLRQERYGLMRGVPLPGSVIEQLDAILQEGTVETFVLLQQSPAIGATLGALGMMPPPAAGPGTAPPGAPAAGPRSAHAIAVVRSGRAITALDPEFELRVGDVLVLTGTHREMQEALRRLDPAREPETVPAKPAAR